MPSHAPVPALKSRFKKQIYLKVVYSILYSNFRSLEVGVEKKKNIM
jgi:hypothetical protein